MTLPIINNLQTDADLLTDITVEGFSSLNVTFEKQFEKFTDILKKSIDKQTSIFNDLISSDTLKESIDKQTSIFNDLISFFKKESIQDEENRREKKPENDPISNPNDPKPNPNDPKPNPSASSGLGFGSLLGVSALAAILIEMLDLDELYKTFQLAGKIIKSSITSIFARVSKLFTITADSPLGKVINFFKSIFGPESKLATMFKPLLKIFSTGLKAIPFVGWFLSLFDFIDGFVKKFVEADNIWEGIGEGIFGGLESVIRGIITIPLDMIKDFAGWIATKLGFPEFEKLLDTFSFDDMFRSAVKWLYDTETNTWFGGLFDNVEEKFDDLGKKITTVFEDWMKWIYNSETGELFGINFKEIFDIIPSIDDIKNKFLDMTPDLFLNDEQKKQKELNKVKEQDRQRKEDEQKKQKELEDEQKKQKELEDEQKKQKEIDDESFYDDRSSEMERFEQKQEKTKTNSEYFNENLKGKNKEAINSLISSGDVPKDKRKMIEDYQTIIAKTNPNLREKLEKRFNEKYGINVNTSSVISDTNTNNTSSLVRSDTNTNNTSDDINTNNTSSLVRSDTNTNNTSSLVRSDTNTNNTSDDINTNNTSSLVRSDTNNTSDDINTNNTSSLVRSDTNNTSSLVRSDINTNNTSKVVSPNSVTGDMINQTSSSLIGNQVSQPPIVISAPTTNAPTTNMTNLNMSKNNRSALNYDETLMRLAMP